MNNRLSLFGAPLAPLASFVAVALAACADNTAGHVSLAMSSVRPNGAIASGGLSGGAASPTLSTAGDTTVITLGNDTIIVRSVEIVLREVELKRVEAAECDSVMGNDDCEEFETGATLVSLPLGSAPTETVVSVDAPAGMYDELEFKIHKPEAPEDAAFIAANPSFDGVSIRVTGTYSQAGTRSNFTFTSELNTSQESFLSPPLTVSDGEAVNLTLRVDVSTWFLNAAGTALVDPASANKGQPNENVVRDRIVASFDAFRDDNHDGHDDDGVQH
ncbi:MAG TPA: hypothetical protein VKD28_10440 [Gemmatimonadales bacterium]|nr:hypothetical protein [Gemmatimonadales bacterium]